MGSNDSLAEAEREVADSLPELDEIADDELRAKVRDVWVNGMMKSEYESLDQMKWGGGYDKIDDEYQIDHVREVTQCAIALADTLIKVRGLDIDRDELVAGGLLHDISKFHEMAPDVDGWTDIGELLSHPHYSVHMLEDAELSTHIQHIALVHTHRSKPQPKTIEAQIVLLADLASGDAIFWDNAEELMFDIPAENMQ